MIRKALMLGLVGLIGGLVGCKNREVNMSYSSIQEVHELSSEYHFHVLRIDGCHYLLLEVDRNVPHEGFGFFSHRGNCPNPIHRYDSSAWASNPIDENGLLVGVPLPTDSLFFAPTHD